jgi:hypothetical protein
MFGVKLKGYPKPLRIQAEKVEDDKKNAQLCFKGSNGKVVARFDSNQIAGWWTEPKETDLAEVIKSVSFLQACMT